MRISDWSSDVCSSDLTIFWSGNVKQRSRSGNGSAKRRLSGASERLPLAADMPSVGSAGDQSSSLRNEGPNPVGISLCRVPSDLVQPYPRLTLGFGDFASCHFFRDFTPAGLSFLAAGAGSEFDPSARLDRKSVW